MYDLFGLVVLAVDKGVEEVNYTLDFIASEEFVTHTCNAGMYCHSYECLDQEYISIEPFRD